MSDSDIYACVRCGAHGVKLWRSYSTFDPDLKCVDCSCTEQTTENERTYDAGAVAEDGSRPTDLEGYGPTWEIGWRVPAVPINHLLPLAGYWGYTSIPVDPGHEHHQDWKGWLEMPLRMEETADV